MQAVRSARDRNVVQISVDAWLLVLVAALSLLGYVMMGSASMDYAAEQYRDPFYHIIRHGIFLGLGFGVLLVVARVPVELWQRGGPFLLVAGYALLLLVLIPGIGREVNGARRWIGLGIANMQPSELMKLFFVVYLAGFMARRQKEVSTTWAGMGKPLVLLGVAMALLLAEPDFGAAVVTAGAAMGMLFVAGARLLQFILIGGLGITAAGMLAVFEPYRMKRLVTFIDPWQDQFASGYQLTQALIAFGRGEFLGVGLGNSVQKLFYLPEAHTDFVFAIIAEELGMLGGLVVLGLFTALIGRILWIGRRAARKQQNFAAYTCCGIALLLAAQVFINVGVNAGLLPTKGLTLPFLSYGGSSLLILFGMMGLVLRVEYELRVPPGSDPAFWRRRHG